MRFSLSPYHTILAQEKFRLDDILIQRGLAPDIKRAQSLILSGSVLVDDREETRSGIRLPKNTNIRIRERIKTYVSRGAYKLLGALQAFPGISWQGRIGIDMGASTGGFTQILLENGIQFVIAIDVGYGQMADRLQKDERVKVLDRFHIKDLTWDIIKSNSPPSKDYFFTMDLSFISLRSVFPVLQRLKSDDPSTKMEGIALVKPQFEIQETNLLEKGILRDRKKAIFILMSICRFVKNECGGKILGLSDSPITGADGNREFLLHFLL